MFSSHMPAISFCFETVLNSFFQIPSGVTTVRPNRKFQDPFFAILYIFSMMVFFIAGIVLLAKTDVSTVKVFIQYYSSNFILFWGKKRGSGSGFDI